MNLKLLTFTATLLLLLLAASAYQQSPIAQAQTAPKPFILPFKDPPGPNTWQLGQLYGNTTGAYQNRRNFYLAGQGLHFGLDFSTACGTPVTAIGDGVVLGADTSMGSAPHNLVIDHRNGYWSLYGHLLQKPKLKAGDVVKQGDVVALSGDPDSTCHSRPHLHLEIRANNNERFINPITVIEADWDTLALTGQFGRGFERDLNNPRQWQTMYDQPDGYRNGAPLINDYKNPWPPAFDFR